MQARAMSPDTTLSVTVMTCLGKGPSTSAVAMPRHLAAKVRAKAHFPPPPVNGHAQHPLPATILALVEPKPAAIGMPARCGGLHRSNGQLVQGMRGHLIPLFIHVHL